MSNNPYTSSSGVPNKVVIEKNSPIILHPGIGIVLQLFGWFFALTGGGWQWLFFFALGIPLSVASLLMWKAKSCFSNLVFRGLLLVALGLFAVFVLSGGYNDIVQEYHRSIGPLQAR